MRFTLDWETLERKKLNDNFEFPVEINMSKYVSPELLLNATEDDLIYELKSIVIHRGGCYGGHYYAYIKDDYGVGSWHVELPEQYEDKPSEKTRKGFNQEDYLTDQQKEALNDEKNKNNPKYKQGKKNKKNNKNKGNEKEVTYEDYSKCDFPLPYSDKRLIQGWYEFNDATVNPIAPGILQSKFGGSNDGNAYMLIYRQRTMN